MITLNSFRASANNECVTTDEENDESYDLTLHIISAIVLLIVSFVGAIFSIITTRVRCLRVSPVIINVGKFFGSGVVLATGFIHMLPPAMEALTDPCLPDSWNVYGAYAGLFAMSAALIMQLIEFIARQRYQSNRDSETYPLFGSKSESSGRSEQSEISESAHHSHGFGLQDDIQNRKISTYLLEFGIALHSVLIGLTLGTTINSFVPLFIALSLHQFFEAIALGAQIARLDQLPLRSAIFMVIFFTFTTPVGIAIGIGIHSTTYSPKSVLSLLINGILDSVSGGILIYVALVNLITAEMGAGARAFHLLSKQLKFLYFISLYAGVAAMAVIGRWV